MGKGLTDIEAALLAGGGFVGYVLGALVEIAARWSGRAPTISLPSAGFMVGACVALASYALSRKKEEP